MRCEGGILVPIRFSGEMQGAPIPQDITIRLSGEMQGAPIPQDIPIRLSE